MGYQNAALKRRALAAHFSWPGGGGCSAGPGWTKVENWLVPGRSDLLALHRCESELRSKK